MTLPHWSQTSLRLFITCPKAWMLTYHRERTNRAPSTTGQSMAPNLHLAQIRAGRATMIERFQALYNGELWTRETVLLNLERQLEAELGDRTKRYPDALLRGLLSTSIVQLEALKHTRTLRRVFDQHAPRWAYFPRSHPMSIHGIRLFAAPDLMIFHQHKWTLVRIRFGPRPNPKQADAEARLMAHWSMAHEALPSNQDAYRIRTLSWSEGAWEEHRVAINPTLLSEAWGLMSSDVRAMRRTQRLVREHDGFAAVPLAQNAASCTLCRWKTRCLGERTLSAAKRDQIEGLLALHHNEATRSASTASTS